MKIFTCKQIQSIDAFTIEHEPILSIDLMERAANNLFRWIVANYPYAGSVAIFLGQGNNGGDGAAIGRMLFQTGYNVSFYILDSSRYSPNLRINLKRLTDLGIKPILINTSNDFPSFDKDALIIDSLFGSGLSKPIEGIAAHLISNINNSDCQVVSIDIPSGLFGEENPFPNCNPVVNATYTLTLQFPKLCLFFSENYSYVGQWHIIDIGLHPKVIEQSYTPYSLIDKYLIKKILLIRKKFQHKGNFGNCLLVAGSFGMLGAAALCAKACLKAGAGLVNVHIPRIGYSVLHNSLPEAIVQVDENDLFFTNIPEFSKFTSIGFGPGVGIELGSKVGLQNILLNAKCPLIIDADGLNIIAQWPELLSLLPQNTIITPHVGEFRRLFGDSDCESSRLKIAIEESKKHNIIIVIKGAHTQVVCPNGEVFFNSTGNPGMATAGSGDVLTGIITSLVGQGYSSVDAAIAGTFIHGLAGDLAAEDKGQQALMASDIINYLDKAFLYICNDL
jgi:NAD(P)H-hydrate epimerase